jgi:hypothetical protein
VHGPGAGSGAWEGGARVQLGEISLNFPPRWHGPATGVPCGGWARRLGIDHVRARRSQVIIFFILFSYIQFVTQKMFMTLDGCEQIFARMESGNSAISICQWKKKKNSSLPGASDMLHVHGRFSEVFEHSDLELRI